jgi:hypothetical protein
MGAVFIDCRLGRSCLLFKLYVQESSVGLNNEQPDAPLSKASPRPPPHNDTKAVAAVQILRGVEQPELEP